MDLLSKMIKRNKGAFRWKDKGLETLQYEVARLNWENTNLKLTKAQVDKDLLSIKQNLQAYHDEPFNSGHRHSH